MWSKGRNEIWLSAFFFLSNLIFRIWNCDEVCLSGDELFTMYFSQFPIADIIKILSQTNNPPTFEIMLHYWQQCGESTKWLRALPAFFTAFAAMPLFLVACKMSGKLTALAVSLLFLFSSFQMDYAHLMRAYSLLGCAALWSIYFFIRLVEEEKKLHAVWWLFASLTMCVAHYLGWLVIAAELVTLVLAQGYFKKNYRRIGKLIIVLIIIYAPLAFVLIQRFLNTASNGTSTKPLVGLSDFYNMLWQMLNKDEYVLNFILVILSFGIISFSGFIKQLLWRIIYITTTLLILILPLFIISHDEMSSIGHNRSFAFFYGLIVLAFLLVVLRKGHYNFTSKLVLVWTVGLFAGVFALSFFIPMFVDRYIYFLGAGFLLLIGQLFFYKHKYYAQPLLFIVCFYLFVQSFNYQPERKVYPDKAVQKYKEIRRQNEWTIVSPGYHDVVFTYYYNHQIFSNWESHKADTAGEKIVHETNYPVYKEGLRRALFAERIVIVNDSGMVHLPSDTISHLIYYSAETALAYPQNGILPYLIARYGEPVEHYEFDNDIHLYSFQK